MITGLSVGGAEMMLFKLLSNMEKSEFENSVVSLREEGKVGKMIEALDLPVFYLHMSRGIPSPTSILKLKKVIKDTSPDIIQGWMYHANLAATICSHLTQTKVPILWNIRQTLYGFKEERWLTRVVVSVGAKLSKKAKKIIYNSNLSLMQHNEFGFSPNNSVFIPNGFDLKKFAPSPQLKAELRNELNIPQDSLLIGLIARYHPMKGHNLFLEAAASLNAQHPSVHFLLAGSDVDQANKKLSAQIEALGLEHVVHLLGERMDIPRITAGLDVATSCSFTIEGFSNAIGEAMACGVPVVATDVGDASFLVADAGKIIPIKNLQALVQGWKEFIEMGKQGREQIGNKGRERIESHFGLKAISEQYQNLYRSVI